MSHLLHPELFEQIPLMGGVIASELERAASVASNNLLGLDNNVSVVIRTLNEKARLEGLLQGIQSQVFAGEVEVIVVDNESTDGTRDMAKSFGAEIVTIPRGEFTYPRSMNLGMEAASHPDVFLTVGHARLSNNQLLRAGVKHLDDPNVGGVHSLTLPNDNASSVEKTIAIGTPLILRPAHQVKKAGMGVMGATNAIFSKSAWEDLGKFDERYEDGGEDTALAAKMLANGLKIIFEPALAVHHTHGLGAMDSLRQFRQWQRMLKGPNELDFQKLAARRPDINFE